MLGRIDKGEKCSVSGCNGEAVRSISVDKVKAAGLAKEHELLFTAEQDQPIELDRRSQALYLLQRIRDEAHRFAISAHRNLRSKERLVSKLDQIPGIGPARRKALLSKFGSTKDLQKASIEDIARTPGITLKLAQAIMDFLCENH